MNIHHPRLYLLFLLLLCLIALACPMPEPPGGEGELEAVQSDNVQLASKRFENDTAIIESGGVTFKFHGNWNDKYNPKLLITVIISNNSKNTLILKFSELNLKSSNGEGSIIGDIVKNENNGSRIYIRHARKDDKPNTDLPEDVKLLPGSKSEFNVVFGTSEMIENDGGGSLFYFSLPTEFENIANSEKDLKVVFKTVGNRATNKLYPVD